MSKRRQPTVLGAYIARRRCAAVVFMSVLVMAAGCDRKGESRESRTGSADGAKKVRVGVLPAGAEKPNVVFVLVDALRADRLGAYGNRDGLTPTMDSLAAGGVTFNYCVAPAPWTLPSVASIFTAFYPGVHKATSYRTVESMEEGRTAQQSILSDDFTTLAEVLKANGYDTAGFCGNKFIREKYGFGQGFDHFDTSFADTTVSGEKLNEAAWKWLEGRASKNPLFLYLHYMDVHGPYDAAPRFMDPLMAKVEANKNKRLLDSRELRRLNAYLNKPPRETSDPGRYNRLKGYREYWEARYDAGVAEADFYLNQMFARLAKMGVLDNALIVLVADHGEALCEHGLWGHGYSQYQTDLHVPLIMAWKGVLPAGKRVRRLAGLIDLKPTITEMLRIPATEELQGKSLVDHLSGTLPKQPQIRFAEAVKAGPTEIAVFADTLKLILKQIPARRMPDGSTSRAGAQQRLYNLVTDPGEEFDTADQDPQRRDMLSKFIIAFMRDNSQIKPNVRAKRKPVESETMAKLESLGYVGGSEEQDPNDKEAESQPTSAPAPTP